MKKNKKFLNYLLLIIAVISINFFIPKLLPGSPITYLVGENPGLLSSNEKNQIINEYKLNEPLYIQFLYYLKNVFTLDFGMSFSKKQPIFNIVKSATFWTLLLSICNILISTILGSYLGFKSAMKKRDTNSDLKMNIIMSSISCFPVFWVSMLLVVIFSINLNLFPSYGAYTIYADYNIINKIIDVIMHMVLPLSALVFSSISVFYVQMRMSILQVLDEDYIFMARVKSLPNDYITRKYILRNSLIPVFTIFMINIGYIFSGSIVVETVFSYPGLGKIMYDAIIARDYPLIQYCFLIVSVMVILSNYVADKLYKYIDPRVVDN